MAVSRMKLIPAVDRGKLAVVLQVLRDHYGPRERSGSRDPVDELVLTILSQNTSDRNSGRAFRLLKAAYPTYEAVLAAPVSELYEVIKAAGLGNIKAPRIQAVLSQLLARRGNFDLSFLGQLPLAEAKSWLTSLPGIGPKTAGCVLCFACDLPVLAVDTHIHRVAQRLGLIGPKVNADQAHDLLETALLPAEVYEFHVNMILHGRQICHALRPECGRCPLQELCEYYRTTVVYSPA
ncbi:MAG: endonuclease III [Herpetosiphonaceae bacterium]|nr:endonuclease III [Herpetosiphonaceae bacterium]